MSNHPKPERLNIFTRQVVKYAELVAPRDRYLANVRKLTVDINHLDATIGLFDGMAKAKAASLPNGR